ncbi:MAG: cysteine--tRNA ligase [Candidatus Campbellbacteria bacterium]|nr:cysteine--tRNA ligase [Candidatus Campbellbacteria bacterium]
MAIKLYNTYTREKEEFYPLNPPTVTMYNCGPTVYDYAHIGNLRGYVNADLLRRLLEHNGYEVKQVINITDVGHLVDDGDEGEDKIEKGAKREKKSVEEIIEHYTQAFLDDLQSLNIDTSNVYKYPRATDHISEQIELIKTLEEKGYTYTTSDGVYFDTAKYEDYGKLSNLDVEGLKEGIRVEANPEKRNSTDFALWKFSKPEEKREQEWDSPWGIGFPGWHIECSAMAMKYLGETLDIHTGGIDHIPVHHTNEIAQSVCATGRPFSRFWLHHEFVNVKEGKMAKSEGNFIRLKTLRDRGYEPLHYRYLLLQAHYRSIINFSFEALEASAKALSRLVHFYAELKEVERDTPKSQSNNYEEEFFASLEDDINSAEALAVVWKLIKDETIPRGEKKYELELFDSILGLGLSKLSREIYNVPPEIEELARERQKAKEAKNYELADELRDKITSRGFVVRDTKDGYEIESAKFSS